MECIGNACSPCGGQVEAPVKPIAQGEVVEQQPVTVDTESVANEAAAPAVSEVFNAWG